MKVEGTVVEGVEGTVVEGVEGTVVEGTTGRDDVRCRCGTLEDCREIS